MRWSSGQVLGSQENAHYFLLIDFQYPLVNGAESGIEWSNAWRRWILHGWLRSWLLVQLCNSNQLPIAVFNDHDVLVVTCVFSKSIKSRITRSSNRWNTERRSSCFVYVARAAFRAQLHKYFTVLRVICYWMPIIIQYQDVLHVAFPMVSWESWKVWQVQLSSHY